MIHALLATWLGPEYAGSFPRLAPYFAGFALVVAAVAIVAWLVDLAAVAVLSCTSVATRCIGRVVGASS